MEFVLNHLPKIASIALLNLIVYYRTLFYGYVGDDVERSERKEPAFKNKYHRWWIQFIGLRHTNSMVAHFITLITHTICCVMMYFAFGMNDLAWLSAILFSINPANMQGSIWISGRNYVTSAILVLFMYALPKVSWIFYMATSSFAVNAWFAPLIFLGTKYWYMVGIIPLAWLLHPSNRETIHRKLWETGGLKTTNSEMRAIKPQKIVPYLKTYLYYFVMCLFPFRLGVEHNFLRGFGTNKTDNKKGYALDKYFFAGLLVFSFSLYMSFKGMFYGWTPLSIGLFWFIINISMWGNFCTYQQHIAERYVYLANMGMMYSLSYVILNIDKFIANFLK